MHQRKPAVSSVVTDASEQFHAISDNEPRQRFHSLYRMSECWADIAENGSVLGWPEAALVLFFSGCRAGWKMERMTIARADSQQVTCVIMLGSRYADHGGAYTCFR